MKHRKLLSILLALVMLVGLLPAAALAEEEELTWNGLAAAMKESGTIQLTKGLTYAVGDDVLVVPENVTVTLDLNGSDLDGYDFDKEVGVEAVITVLGTLILEDKSTDGDGCIEWSDGVGVYVAEGGTFTMYGGDIYDNDIAGVYVAKGGTFTMYGGDVDDNDVGVYVEGGGAFTMSDGEIYGEIYDNDTAGVYVADGGAFTMRGGMIYYNDAVGLMVVDGAAEMSGGVIADNEIGVLAVGTKKADKPNFTLSGGVIGAAYNEESWPDPWDDGNKIGVMVGCSFDPAEIPKDETFEKAFAQYYEDVGIEDMLTTPAAGAVGGSFAMTGGAISANDVMGVMVVGGYDEAADGTVTFRARFDMSGGVITDMPDAKIVEALTETGKTLPEIIGDSVSLKIGVFVNGGDFAMTGSAKVVGAWTEEYGCLPVSVEVDEDEHCTTLELGVYQASGNFAMAESTEISGHNIMGLGQGYVIDTIMKLLMDLLPEGALKLPAIDLDAKRPGSHVTVNGAIKNNGVVGVFAFGDGEATDSGFTYDTTFTLSPTGVIADGDRMAIAAIEQKSEGEKPVVERITSFGAKVGLIAVGTEVNVAGGITGQETLSPFVTTTPAKAAAGETPATPEMIDVQVELGAILSDCVFNLAEGGSVSGHNLGGVFAAYHDDLLALILEVAGDDIFALLQKSGKSFQEMQYSDFEALVHRFVIQNKTGIVLNLLGAVKNNGIFGIGTVGTLTNKPSIPAVVNVIGGAVEDNKNIGVGGLFTQINVANGGSISGSGLGALAVGASAVNVAEGGAITGNTTGAAAALLSNVNVVGGSVVDNTKAFTVNPVDAEGASKDSLDDLLALVGTLPAGVTNILEQAVLPLIRTYLGGVTDTENEYYKAAKTVEYLINNFLHIDFEVDEENPAKYMDMVRQMTEDFQQVGVVVETMTSAVNVASGEISGNAHGVLGLSVDTEKDFAEILSGAPDAIKKLFPTPGITFNGAVPMGNTADDLSLFVMTSIDVDKDNVPTPADQKLENAPTVTVAANLGDAVVKTAERQGVVRYCEDAVVPFEVDGLPIPDFLTNLVSMLSGVQGVDYEPVAEIPFTVGIADGKGSVDNFQSAMEGYLVTAETDGELMFIEGVTELTLTEEDQTLTVNEGNTLQLHAAVKAPEGCSTAVVWTSSDETVATVSASGLVTGVKEGTVTVTVTADGGVSKTCQVKVTPKAADTPTYIGSTSESVKTTVTVNGTDYEVKATVTDGVLTPNSADMAKLLANLNSIISMEIDARGTGATSAVLPEAVAKTLHEKMTEDSKGVAFITDECALLLNPAAVAYLFADAPGSLTVGIEKIAEKDLNANQIRQVQGLDVAALLRTNVRVGGKAIHELGTDGEALMLTNASESKTLGAAMKAAYLAPSATSIAETAGRIAAFDVGGFAFINGGRLSFNSEVRSNTCSEYVLYYEAAETDADADAVASCGHGDDCPLAAFTDVDPNAWYHDGVHYVLLKGWMQGLGDGIFDPGGTTTRAMAAQLLWNMEGKPAATAAVPFADVAADAWYASAVAWAAENGVVEGWTDAATGKQVFAPDEFVTREQFAAMLYRYAKLHGLGFTGLWSFQLEFPDAADVSDWAIEAMSWMVMQGIINGIDGKLAPQGSSTRAQIATMVYRYDAIPAE